MSCKTVDTIFKIKKARKEEDNGNSIKFEHVKGRDISNRVFEGGELQVFIDGCDDITISSCIFKNVRSDNGHAILIYNSKNITIEDCTFIDMKCGNSEAVAINTGTTDVSIINCLFKDIDNLPLDVISGERDSKYTGRVEIVDNEFINCGYRDDYWTAAGPYIDGASDILIEGNKIHCKNEDGKNSAMGIEIGAENERTARNIIVRSNTIRNARVSGIIYGSYKRYMGGVSDVAFIENNFIDCAEEYLEQYNCENIIKR